MSKDSNIEVARIQSRSAILVVIISSAVTCFVGFLTIFFAFPPFQEWVKGWGSNPKVETLTIEQVPQRIFAYYGNAEKLGGFAKTNLLFDGTGKNPYYELDYTIPADQTGYAGLAFQFEEGLNVTNYEKVVFTIQFDDVNNTIEFYLKDIGGKKYGIPIIGTDTNDLTLRYNLENFSGVNLNAIQEVGLNAQSTYSQGRHVVTIHQIRFER